MEQKQLNKRLIALLIAVASVLGYTGYQVGGSVTQRFNAPATTGVMTLVGGVGVQLAATNTSRHYFKVTNTSKEWAWISCDNDKPAAASNSPFLLQPFNLSEIAVEFDQDNLCTGGVRATSTGAAVLTIVEY